MAVLPGSPAFQRLQRERGEIPRLFLQNRHSPVQRFELPVASGIQRRVSSKFLTQDLGASSDRLELRRLRGDELPDVLRANESREVQPGRPRASANHDNDGCSRDPDHRRQFRISSTDRSPSCAANGVVECNMNLQEIIHTVHIRDVAALTRCVPAESTHRCWISDVESAQTAGPREPIIPAVTRSDPRTCAEPRRSRLALSRAHRNIPPLQRKANDEARTG